MGMARLTKAVYRVLFNEWVGCIPDGPGATKSMLASGDCDGTEGRLDQV